MTRRISTQKRFPDKDFKYNSLLVSLFVNRLLKAGKKQLAKRILYNALIIIEQRNRKNPINILENATKNASPRVQLKPKRIAGANYQTPNLLTRFQATNIAVCWLIKAAKKRSIKGITLNLANELLDAAKGIGSAVKKKEEMHKMAEANKAIAIND